MEDLDALTPTTPRLWNPNAAANWSLLFSPIFGAWVQARNWQALNQPGKARNSMMWVYFGFVFLLVVLFLPDGVGATPGIIFLLVWYSSSGKGQAKLIKDQNINYEKKTWDRPLLLGLAGFIAYLSVAVAIFWTIDPSIDEIVESESVSLVTQLVHEQLGGTANCSTVSIKKEISPGFYRAVAHLDNGDELEIVIELNGDMLSVGIPNQGSNTELNTTE